jgi:signal transduction histidine kinase
MQVAFSQQDLPRSVPPDIALCLFRVVQEALRNVHKHSGAPHAEVRIELVDSTLHLCISDNGVGFDVEDASRSRGLGLWSMRERIRLVSGRFEIHSGNHLGTRIDVWTPIQRSSDVGHSEPITGQTHRTATTSELDVA